MKKIVGFIFTLILVVLFENVASVKAGPYLIGVKDYHKEQPKKSKNANKSKKTSKKAKKSKKRVSKPVKFISATSYFTNKIDSSQINYQDELISIIRQEDGYLGIPEFLRKYKDADDSCFVSVGANVTSIVEYQVSGIVFKFLTSKDISSLTITDLYDYNGKLEYERTLKRLEEAGIKLSFSKKFLEETQTKPKTLNVKFGDAYWILKFEHDIITLERVVEPISVTERDIFKAITRGRLNITPTFYEKLLTLINKTDIIGDRYRDGIVFGGRDLTMEYFGASGLVEEIGYYDVGNTKDTVLRIEGELNGDSIVEELSSLLKNYCGIDFNEFDVPKLRKIIEEDSFFFESFDDTKYYGKNSINVYVSYSSGRGIVYIIRVEVYND